MTTPKVAAHAVKLNSVYCSEGDGGCVYYGTVDRVPFMVRSRLERIQTKDGEKTDLETDWAIVGKMEPEWESAYQQICQNQQQCAERAKEGEFTWL